MKVALRQTVLSALLVLLLGACRYFDAGIGPASVDAADGAPAPVPDGGGDPVDGALEVSPTDRPPLQPSPPPGIDGPPATIGCADGSREGFVDPAAWRRIAGCSGAWTVPGVRSADSRAPQCARAAGNTGTLSSGLGCSVADLCASGWHVCEDGEDVRRSSPTECESAIFPPHAAFFLTRAAASSYGLCAADPAFSNDLHGCGNYGQPESGGCRPLNRRLSFVDCLASTTVWSCGDSDRHLAEAALVIKSSAALGGVLCCLDP